jgi:hypothetical protein
VLQNLGGTRTERLGDHPDMGINAIGMHTDHINHHLGAVVLAHDIHVVVVPADEVDQMEVDQVVDLLRAVGS